MGGRLSELAAPGAGSAASRDLDPTVLAAAATGVVAYIERQKGDLDRIFGYAGISPEMAGSPTLQLSLKSYCRLFEESARLTHNDNFGLWFGHSFEPRDLGLWGYAAVSAPTLGMALGTLVDLFPLHQQSSSMQLVADADGLHRLEYRIDAPDIVERRQDAELSLGMFLNLFRECLGPTWAPDEVHFEHPKPPGWREHERAFAAPAFFSQPTNALLFRPEILSMPMPARDTRLMSAMRLCLERLSERNDLRVSVTDRVRAAVRARLPDGFPSLEFGRCRAAPADRHDPARAPLRRAQLQCPRRGDAARSGTFLHAPAPASVLGDRVSGRLFGALGLQPRGAPLDRPIAAIAAHADAARAKQLVAN